MGVNKSKFDNLAIALHENDLTKFQLALKKVNSNDFLQLSSNCCQVLKVSEGWDPPLPHFLCYFNKLEYLELLFISFDMDPDFQDQFGFTCLMRAASCSNADIASFFLDKGADVDKPNQFDSADTALHYACEAGELKTASLLLNRTKKVDVLNQEGMSPLMYAVQKRRLKLIKELLRHGADPFVKDKSDKNSFDYARELKYDDREMRVFLGNNRGLKTIRSEHDESVLTLSDRSLIKEGGKKAGFFMGKVWEGIDFLITDKISWC